MSGIFHFSGGVHPKELRGGKEVTAGEKIIVAPLPSRVIIPMQQHIGAMCRPLVEKGDHVLVGQMIGEPVGKMSAAVHASVSGTVVAVEDALVASGQMVPCVIIDNDFKDEWVPLDPIENPMGMTRSELCELARSKGVVGLGGATFPTAVKLDYNPDKKVDTLIVNGAECEPYLTSDNRQMIEYAREIVEGIELIRSVLGIEKAVVGIENNKPEAIAVMTEEAKRYDKIRIVGLRTLYPQGGEKMLVYALTGRVVKMGGLPLDVGTVVCNVGTCRAMYRAAYEGRPLIDRIVTVAGSVSSPANYCVRLGAPVEWLIDSSGKLLPEARVLVHGGPMMGVALSRLDIPITKCCNGITALKRTDSLSPESACIRCGRCMNACPMKLSPVTIDHYVRKKMFDEAKKLNAMNCMECGCCTYVCPAHRKLKQSMCTAKTYIKRAASTSSKKGD